ncbi:transcriptional regulator [Mesorhizobium sp. M4B.F.Ca.ET.190.01.1.1]|uniref:DJ-1/PfpI family protein n=1 Tax=unclassified Mesorhizobium TaxID=325217 RepID=UPI0010919569|nr:MULTISPECIES: DJ-1/PfpI family protein [unclassified Mesorhizobium]TGR12139.1 transcriptional regulator [Mesorhizobium sp. M4B.F.Ca.ET.200.01.1.1]TGS20456.1 transcriptional regulator [Mesorhizobium sp. M4B.F.Ca.ET.190.01.1.1]TGT31873.1 transcriptional regulator [Mesorhizobium sp. M4B.F.Ca.ET.172.01.1.1]
MRLRTILWSGVAAVLLVLVAGAGWVLSLPPASDAFAAPAIDRQEADATVAALRPRKRQRPLVAIIGINDATETTDYLMPYGILRRADVADVMMLATQPGPVTLFPVLKVQPDATVAEFDARHPQGADYVIVPAMSRDDDPAVLEWLKRQSAKGAIVIGICAGAKVVGASGLLDGKRATTHWYSVGELRDRHPSIHYVADRRFVVDQDVATTTGITASMPMMLTLIEAIAGRRKAEAVAHELGLTGWDARHASGAFKFTRPFALTAISNTLAFWDREQLGLELTLGMDEVSLALVADAWSRTYRSRAVTISATTEAVTSRNGMRILPDQVIANWPSEARIAGFEHQPPAVALDQALRNIADRYGTDTTDFVAMQLEYPKQSAAQ